MLVEDERSGELRIQCQRHRQHNPLDSTARVPFGGELRVPGTIIQHVVSDRRGVLLGDAADGDGDANGTRMGAPLIYHGAHYGVVYVEGKQQVFARKTPIYSPGDRDELG